MEIDTNANNDGGQVNDDYQQQASGPRAAGSNADHYSNPRNVGSFEKSEENVGTGIVGAPECGDVMKLQLKISDQGVVEDAKFKTFGCGSAIASSSYVTELVKGKNVEEVEQIKNSVIVDELSLPPVKVHCSVLAEDAIKAAVKDWRENSEKEETKAKVG